MASVAVHFGRWLEDRIGASMKTKTQFAAEAEVSRSRLQDWTRDAAPSIQRDKLGKMASVLGMPYETVLAELNEAERQHLPPPDSNLEKGTLSRFVEIPTFDRELAAGGWTEAIFVDESEVTQSQLEQGLFRVRLRGDSMSPKYKDGCNVEFRVLRICREGLIVGGDFYIQRDDDLATFKRVARIETETIVLHAINRKKYPDPMVVDRSRIVRCAKAVAIIQGV